MRDRRWAGSIAAATVLLGLVPGLAAAGAGRVPGGLQCDDASRIVKGPDGWSAIAPPAFAAGGDRLVSYALDPRDPTWIFVTNGTTIVRSTDGGCTFEEVYALPSAGGTDGHNSSNSSIRALVFPDSPDAPGVHAVIGPADGVAPAPILLFSVDGETWAPTGEGLPLAGDPQELVFSGADPQRAYLVVDRLDALSEIYSSRDGGATFAPAAAPPPDVASAGHRLATVTDLAVDPASPDDLWAATSAGLLHSADGGGTWTSDARVAFRFSTVLVLRPRAETATILAFRSDPEYLVYLSDDGGQTWQTLSGPYLREPAPFGSGNRARQLPVVSAVAGRGGDVVTSMDAPSEVHRLVSAANGSWENITAGRPALRDLAFDRLGNGRLYGLGDYGLYRYDGLAVPSVKPPSPFLLPDRVYCLVDERDLDGTHHDGTPPSLTPRDEVVTLDEGESAVVAYELDVRSAPVLLDVFFLLDTSLSMDDIMCGIARSLATVVANVSVQVPDIALGLGEYNDHFPYPHTAGEGYHECLHTYKRRVAISPPSDEIARTLQRMPTCGGREPALIALEEVVEGDGQDLRPAGPSEGDIPAGTGAGWRTGPGAHQRVVVHATDEVVQYFDDGPTMADVTELLSDEGVHHVGISGSELATADLETLSSGTLALSGVDCDGDDRADVAPGEPLVCPMFHKSGDIDNLGAALVEIFRSLSLKGDVDVAATDGGAGVVAGVTPGAFPSVDFRVDHLLPFTVRYQCPRIDEDKTFPVRVRAGSAGRLIDRVVTRVRCLDVPAKLVSPPGAPRIGLAPPVLPPPLPPPAPVARVTQPQPHAEPAAQVNSQTQAQGQGQPQAAAVPQKQTQPQVALVHAAQSLRERDAMEYAMTRLSARERGPWPDGAGIAAIGLMSALATAWASAGLVLVHRRARVRARR